MHPKCACLSQQTILTLSEHSSKCGTNSKLALFSSMKFSQNLKKMSHFTLTTSHEHSLNLWDWVEPTYFVLVSWSFFKNCSKFSHFTITTNNMELTFLENVGLNETYIVCFHEVFLKFEVFTLTSTTLGAKWKEPTYICLVPWNSWKMKLGALQNKHSSKCGTKWRNYNIP